MSCAVARCERRGNCAAASGPRHFGHLGRPVRPECVGFTCDPADMAPRAPRQPNRLRRRTMPTIKEEQVRVAVATSPSTSDGSIASDVALAKAALLYADEVEMVGLGVSLLEELRQRTNGPVGTLGLLRALDNEALEYVQGPSASRMPENWRTLVDQFAAADISTLPDEAKKLFLDAQATLEEFNDGARPLVDEILGATGATELAVAVEAGAVRIAPLELEISSLFRGKSRRSEESEAQVVAWIDALVDRIQDRKLRILFDQNSTEIVEALKREGRLQSDPTATRLAGQAALGAGLVARLPAFPQAPMDELLDLRKDLAKPIKVYQGAVVRYSRQLPQEIGPDLDFEIGQLWQADVKPAIDGLRDELAHNTLVRELAKNVDSKEVGKFAWTATTAIGVGVVGDLSSLETALLSGAAATPVLMASIIDAIRSRGELQHGARRRDFYMLYEANRRLST